MKSKIGIVLCAFIIAIMFGGGAAGAETSLSLNVTGNAFSDVKYEQSMSEGLPYESNDYLLRSFVVGGRNVIHTHYLEVGNGVVSKTTFASDIRTSNGVMWVDESVQKDVIGSSIVNENVTSAQCYSAEAGYSAAANNLNFESAAHVFGIGVDYAVRAEGDGQMRWTSEEYLASGDIISYVNETDENNTEKGKEEVMNEEDIPMPGGEEVSTFWTSEYVKEDVRASGEFIFEGSYHSEFSDFPAPAPDEEIGGLCPFSQKNGWD